MPLPKTELRRKIKLERRLERRLNSLRREIVRAFEAQQRRTSLPFNVQARAGRALETLLRDHYGRVTPVFDQTTNRQLRRALKATDDERAIIESALTEFNDDRAPAQARRINATTQRAADEAVRSAEREADRSFVEDGKRLTKREKARIARRELDRNLRLRQAGIATVETQGPAEVAKLTEVEVLMGKRPSVAQGRRQRASVDVSKRWDSQGDSFVRDSHLLADGQVVPTNEPFLVGAARLMAPGDGSLGAPLSEIAGCRCSASYDAAQVATARGE